MLLGHARGRFNSKDSWIRVLKFAKAWHQSSRVKSVGKNCARINPDASSNVRIILHSLTMSQSYPIYWLADSSSIILAVFVQRLWFAFIGEYISHICFHHVEASLIFVLKKKKGTFACGGNRLLNACVDQPYTSNICKHVNGN